MNKKRIGTFIKELRKEKKISQERLSNELMMNGIEISTNAISQWEKGETVPDIENIIALSKYFDVTVDDILEGEKYQAIDYKNKYFIYNDDWLHKYYKDKKTNLYEIRQKQINKIKNRFEELLDKRIREEFTHQEDDEFKFIVENFYKITNYLSEEVPNGISEYSRLKNAIRYSLNQTANMPYDERIWELKKLLVPSLEIELTFHDFSSESKNISSSFDKRFKQLDFWEKDIILACLQVSDPICIHEDTHGSRNLQRYEKQNGEEYNEECIVRSKIKYLIENGACINKYYINFIKQRSEKRRIIDRLEYLYNLCEKPLEIYAFDDGKERKYVIENTIRNRFYSDYYYKLFILEKDINLDEAYNFFIQGEEIPDELVKKLAEKYHINLNQKAAFFNADFKMQCGYFIEEWKKLKAREAEIDAGKKELLELQQKLESGIKEYEVVVEDEIGGTDWQSMRDECLFWNREITYSEIKKQRDAKATNDLLKNLDNLSVSEIREKYFVKEVQKDEQ